APFVPKPSPPHTARGWYPNPIPTAITGYRVCEKLPETAKILDRCAVIRCMAHAVRMNNHNSAGYYSLTGVPPATDDQRLRDSQDLFPAYGSIVSKLTPSPPGVAPFASFPHAIAHGSIPPAPHPSFLRTHHTPLP